MATPFLGEIRIFSFNFPPKNWALCNGQELYIAQNTALFSLMGTTYGGNGNTTFGLPDFRGRVPVMFGAGFSLGQIGGAYTNTLQVSQLPAHTHPLNASGSPGTSGFPAGRFLANSGAVNLYQKSSGNLVALESSSLSNTGGSQAHDNTQPYSVLNFCIALTGIYPSQN